MRRSTISKMILTISILACFPCLVFSQGSEGSSDLDKAFDLKIKASSTKDLDGVVKFCESAIQKGLDKDEKIQAEQLAASALYEHAEQLNRRIFPQNPTQRDRRWRILRSQAISRLKKATKYQPDMIEAYLLTTRLNTLPGGNRDQALEAINKAIEVAEDDRRQRSKAYFMRATLRTDEKEQLEDLGEAISADPENLDAVRVRAAYYLRRQEPEKAIDDLNAWLEADPSNTNNHIAVARQLMDMGSKFDDKLQAEAKKFINKAIETDPEKAELYTVRAQLRVFSEDIDEAIEDASKALKIDPKNITALMIRASLYSDQQKLDEAYDDVKQVLEIRPLTENAIRLRGIILSQQGKFDAAIEDFVLLANNDKTNVFYRRQLGMLHNANDEPSKAIRIYNTLLRNNKPSAWEGQPEEVQLIFMRRRAAVLRGRGDARLSKGAHKEAVDDYESALELFEQINEMESKLDMDPSPMDDGVLNNLAWVQATSPKDDVRDGKSAIKRATQAAKLTKYKEAHILSTLASAYAESGDFEKAIKYVKDAIEVNRVAGEKAVEKTATDKQKKSLQEEFENYKQNKPWRELQDVEAEKKAREEATEKEKEEDAEEPSTSNKDDEEKDAKEQDDDSKAPMDKTEKQDGKKSDQDSKEKSDAESEESEDKEAKKGEDSKNEKESEEKSSGESKQDKDKK